MSRREVREQIFKILFGIEFHSTEELDEQIALYMEELWVYRFGNQRSLDEQGKKRLAFSL